MQFERTIAGRRVVNSGSVGLPFENGPGAYWTLDLEPRCTAYTGAEQPQAGREEAISPALRPPPSRHLPEPLTSEARRRAHGDPNRRKRGWRNRLELGIALISYLSARHLYARRRSG
jgi:hypothetical protein